ncbi:hypothetical protein [Spirosoma endbachense]|uniref:DUF4279 domain-containing protein n=1 Tax=Spirosoma endbachense TaxID=2666025 RepID=A0A6P1W5M5_9BACT|nr:hypothetical protein [Spirosoma endbachense]QHV99337.1 hypothetical protein GJR95_31910 [Spirosoma endbachense]
MKREICYLNTDLNLIAPYDLAPLAQALVAHGVLFSLYVGPYQNGLWSATFETSGSSSEPDLTIGVMLMAIDGLDEPSRKLWAACTRREFDIGYECGDEPRVFSQHLSTTILARIAGVGARVVLTLYAANPHSGSKLDEK